MTSPEEAVMAETEAKVKDLVDPAKFKFIEFIRAGGESLPTETVVAYTDLDTALAITGLQASRQKIEELAKADAKDRYKQAVLDYSKDDSSHTIVSPPMPQEEDFTSELPPAYFDAATRITELNKKLYDSRVVLHLKGIAPRWMKVIERELMTMVRKLRAMERPEEEVVETYTRSRINRMVAASLVSYEIPGAGIVSDVKLTEKEVGDMMEAFYPSEEQKIVNAVTVLTNATIISDPQVDAGFPSGRDVPAGEPPVSAEGEDSVSLAPDAELAVS